MENSQNKKIEKLEKKVEKEKSELKEAKKDIKEKKRTFQEEKNRLKQEARELKKKMINYGKGYKREFKKALLTAVVAAFGFLVALEWREVLKEGVGILINASEIKNNFVSALIVTIVAVIGLMVITRILSPKKL